MHMLQMDVAAALDTPRRAALMTTNWLAQTPRVWLLSELSPSSYQKINASLWQVLIAVNDLHLMDTDPIRTHAEIYDGDVTFLK